ncbi:MAG TPA: hypothetical protein VLB50_05200 [Ignavibacteriaceae bacterium]|nr:hypothetical protein [Ignavibacteriaceae bacterium]
MKLKYFLIILFILEAPYIFSAPGIIKPLNQKEKTILKESGKNRVYYPVKQNEPSIILVTGPGKLTVKTRSSVSNNENRTTYTIYYNIDGSRDIEVNFKDIDASKKNNNTNYTFSTIQDIVIELGPGEHTLNFRAKDAGHNIIARYLYSKLRDKKLNWVMLSPSPANEPVDLVSHENVIHYYRFSEKRPLKIKIIGPTLLRVLTRFENHYSMKGSINYRLQLKEDGKVLHTYLLSSSFSDITTYKNNNKLIPGKAREFYIEVPRGKHTYTITPMDKDKNTILARVLFPKKDVKLGE